jgi:hypothetical protein
MSWQGCLLCVCGAVSALALFAWLIEREVRKGPGKKPNIRVPRETLWERTNRYHGGRL